jgi:hypothetical protein
MRVEVTRPFNKDISKLRDKKLLLALKSALQQIESAKTLTEIPNLKKNGRQFSLFQDSDWRLPNGDLF